MNWKEYIKNNPDLEWQCEGELTELSAQDDLVTYFMFSHESHFDTEN